MQVCVSAWQRLAAEALHNPLLLAERTAVVLHDPLLHAAVVEGMVALSPHHWGREGEGRGASHSRLCDLKAAVVTMVTQVAVITVQRCVTVCEVKWVSVTTADNTPTQSSCLLSD